MPADPLAPLRGLAPYKGMAMAVDTDGYGRPNFLEIIVPKTAAYTVLITDQGSTFTNKAATASVTFTLPAIALVPTGWWVDFYQSALVAMVITAPSTKMISYDNIAMTTLTVSTTSKMGGIRVRVTYDGALYMATVFLANIAQVIAVS